MAGELLKPTKIYVKPVLSLLKRFNHGRPVISGISHITGGAFYDKISRILPADIDVVIHKSAWKVPQIFKLIQYKGSIPDTEMYHTLNMGIGMVLVVKKPVALNVIAALETLKVKSWIIGEAVRGKKQVHII